MEEIFYANVMDCIMYAMVCTRSDIAYFVSVVHRFMANLGKTHWHALKWILRYLRGSLSIGLSYRCGAEMRDVITGFVYSDYAGSIDTRNSLFGYIFTIFGGLVCWKASLQQVVALSTIEAEFIAAIEAVKEALWL